MKKYIFKKEYWEAVYQVIIGKLMYPYHFQYIWWNTRLAMIKKGEI